MNILFFDVVPTNIVRFFKGAVENINGIAPGTNLFFLLEEDDHNDIEHVRKHYPYAKEISYVQKRKLVWFKDYLKSNNIHAVITNAQRIPDDMVVLAARQNGIKTFMLQHGMYIPFLKRSLKFFLQKLGKTFRYLYYSMEISKALGYGALGLTLKYFKCYVLGSNQVVESIPRDLLNVNKVYVYGDYWKSFHRMQFGYSYEDQLVIGYPDLEDVYGKDSSSLKRGVCYISQTLVEDGRLKKEEQLSFFRRLVESTSKNKIPLHVKLHPRSDLSLFELANDFDHVVFHQDDFPFVTKYVGHYSTLLAKGMMISGDVCIFEYENHPTPDYFKESASNVISELSEISSWLEGDGKVKDNKIQQVFECHPNVYMSFVEDVLNEINKDNLAIKKSSIANDNHKGNDVPLIEGK